MPNKTTVFPLKLDDQLNSDINSAVFELSKTDKISKQQFCIGAIKDKINALKNIKVDDQQ